MGCTSSKKFVIDEDVFGFDTKSKAFFTYLGLSDRDLDLLYTSFYDMDSDSSGAIRIEEFLIYFEVENNDVNKMIFSIFENDDCLSFTSYVATLWYFLSTDTKRIGALTYRLFDQKKDECFSIPQVVSFMKKINQDEPGNFAKIDKSSETLPGYGQRRTEISLNDFMPWSEKNQVIFMPITKTQFMLREKLIGADFWGAQEEKREKNSELNDPYIDVQLRQKLSDLKFEHSNMLRKKELSNREVVVKKGPGRNRLTHIMVQNLTKDNVPKREKKGEVSSTSGDTVSELSNSSSSSKKNWSQQPVAENRRRRSVFKPSLVDKHAGGSKIAPSKGSKHGGSNKYKN